MASAPSTRSPSVPSPLGALPHHRPPLPLARSLTLTLPPWRALAQVAIAYGYRRFPEPDEAAGLQAVVDDAEGSESEPYVYLTDADAAAGAAWRASQWDAGAGPAAQLAEALAVRAAALARMTGLGVGLPGNASCVRRAPHFQAHQPPLNPDDRARHPRRRPAGDPPRGPAARVFVAPIRRGSRRQGETCPIPHILHAQPSYMA